MWQIFSLSPWGGHNFFFIHYVNRIFFLSIDSIVEKTNVHETKKLNVKNIDRKMFFTVLNSFLYKYSRNRGILLFIQQKPYTFFFSPMDNLRSL